MQRKRGVFIVLEGPDKSGKSTHAGLLTRRLRALGVRTVHTREPGGTSFAEAVRKVVLDPAHRVHPMAELLLYEASRAQHTQEILLPALRAGKMVVCERYTLATLVYQGRARGLPLGMIRRLNRLATGGLTPDLTMVLDIPEREFSRRDRDRKRDRLEKENFRFRKKVRRGYRSLARTEPRTTLVDASQSRERVWDQLWPRVERLVSRSRR